MSKLMIIFQGNELDHIFDFIPLIQVENFVEHEFLSPNMLDLDDLPVTPLLNLEFDNLQ